MNNARIEPGQHMKLSMVERIKAMIYRIESEVIVTGDRLHPDNNTVLKFIGHTSQIVHDVEMLKKQLNDKLVELTTND